MRYYTWVIWRYATAAWEIVLSEGHDFVIQPTTTILMIKTVTAADGQNKIFYWINGKVILDDKRERERRKDGEERDGN